MVRAACLALIAVVLGGCGIQSGASQDGPLTIRLGYFPNLTHAGALVGLDSGYFSAALGSSATIEPHTFNAGGDAVTAILSGAIDAAFLGPNPTTNAFTQSHGVAIRVVSGATSGGALLVVKPGIDSIDQLRGKRIADPQLGGTQDVALRWFLKSRGMIADTSGGGDVSVLPQDNSQTLAAFRQGQIDGAWVPEPWASRLVVEGGARILVDERNLWPQGSFVTTNLIAATAVSTDIAATAAMSADGGVTARSPLRFWSSLWPKLAAIVLALAAWQVVVWSGWKPDYVLPGPVPVFQRLGQDLSQLDFYAGVASTLRRALAGYAIAVVLGSTLGVLVARVRVLREAVGSAVLGFQSMPSIAWFPLAILLFQQSEAAILFVVILGAAPAVASGLLGGIDHVQPLLIRVGRVMGARGLGLYRHVILPAALPGFVGGLKQGWAFAWRSLMAGELIVIVAHPPSLGQQLQFARDLADAQQMLALMIVIFVIGVLIDGMFGAMDKAIRRRWGLVS